MVEMFFPSPCFLLCFLFFRSVAEQEVMWCVGDALPPIGMRVCTCVCVCLSKPEMKFFPHRPVKRSGDLRICHLSEGRLRVPISFRSFVKNRVFRPFS